MKILVFLHGTSIMHKNAVGRTREEIVKQVLEGDESVHDYISYVPVGNVVEKLCNWEKQGAKIVYLSSHKTAKDVDSDKVVLKKYKFPQGEVLFCENEEEYGEVAERIMPDIIIEDDCESIGGKEEMTYPHIREELKPKIKSIVVKEFSGIDHLPDKICDLLKFRN